VSPTAGKIAAVPGVDAGVRRPNDLSHAMGLGPTETRPGAGCAGTAIREHRRPLQLRLASSRRRGGGGPVCRLGRALFRDRGPQSDHGGNSEPRPQAQKPRPTLGRRHACMSFASHGLACCLTSKCRACRRVDERMRTAVAWLWGSSALARPRQTGTAWPDRHHRSRRLPERECPRTRQPIPGNRPPPRCPAPGARHSRRSTTDTGGLSFVVVVV